MKRVSCCMLFLIFACVFLEGVDSAQIILNNRDDLEKHNYRWNIELLLEYNPSNENMEIYLRGQASIQVNLLFSDGEIINNDPSAFSTSFRGERDITDGNNPVKRILTLIYIENYWALRIQPHGRHGVLKWFNIPQETRVLDIYFHILYPITPLSKETEEFIPDPNRTPTEINDISMDYNISFSGNMSREFHSRIFIR